MKIRILMCSVVAATVIGIFSNPVSAQDGMYMYPHPVPNYVGASYYNYRPLMPHHLLHTHSHTYYNSSYGACGQCAQTKTTVKWQSGTIHLGKTPSFFSQGRSRSARRGLHGINLRGRSGGCGTGNCGG